MKELECVNCGGQTEIDREHNRIVCPYCDSVFVLDPQKEDSSSKPAENTTSDKGNTCCGCIFLLLVGAFVAFIFLRIFSIIL